MIIINIQTMNFFSKNRIIFWVLIFLVVINISALVSFLVLFSQNTSQGKRQGQRNQRMAFRNELSLTKAQSGQVDAILAGYKNETEPIASDIKDLRARLLDELSSEKPDTAAVNQYIDKISAYQVLMHKASVNQYLALKRICNPDQCRRLSSLYNELYGCQGKGMKCKRIN